MEPTNIKITAIGICHTGYADLSQGTAYTLPKTHTHTHARTHHSSVWSHNGFINTDGRSLHIVQYMHWAHHDVPLFELQLSW
jgi:hypothetical protein